MNTLKEKERICRLEKILELIETAEERIVIASKHLKFQNVFTYPEMLKREIEVHEKAIKRLTSYYNATLAQ